MEILTKNIMRRFNGIKSQNDSYDGMTMEILTKTIMRSVYGMECRPASECQLMPFIVWRACNGLYHGICTIIILIIIITITNIVINIVIDISIMISSIFVDNYASYDDMSS